MNNLTIAKQTLDSREVAQMMEMGHSELLRKIDGINEDFRESKIAFSKYWVESTYKVNGQTRNYRNFLITKRGCEFLAHKTTGTKGNLFTDRYMDKFEQMKEYIQEKQLPKDSYMIEDPVERAKAWIVEQQEKQTLLLSNKKKDQLIGELKPKADYTDRILKNKGLVTTTQIAKDYGMSAQEMNKLLNKLKVQYKQSGQWLLYSKYHSKGYTHSETIDIVRSDGTPDITMNTKWTQKGRLFIYDLLKKQAVLPVIERKIA